MFTRYELISKGADVERRELGEFKYFEDALATAKTIREYFDDDRWFYIFENTYNENVELINSECVESDDIPEPGSDWRWEANVIDIDVLLEELHTDKQ